MFLQYNYSRPSDFVNTNNGTFPAKSIVFKAHSILKNTVFQAHCIIKSIPSHLLQKAPHSLNTARRFYFKKSDLRLPI